MEFKTKKELYEYVWSTRPHESEIDGEPLLPKNHPQWAWQMAHIVPHGSYPAYKFKPENIILMTVKQHEHQESLPEFKRRFEEMKQKYYQDPNIKH